MDAPLFATLADRRRSNRLISAVAIATLLVALYVNLNRDRTLQQVPVEPKQDLSLAQHSCPPLPAAPSPLACPSCVPPPPMKCVDPDNKITDVPVTGVLSALQQLEKESLELTASEASRDVNLPHLAALEARLRLLESQAAALAGRVRKLRDPADLLDGTFAVTGMVATDPKLPPPEPVAPPAAASPAATATGTTGTTGETAAADPFAQPSTTGYFPGVSTVSCNMQADSSDLCEYENVCVDLPLVDDKTEFLRLLLVTEAASVAVETKARRARRMAAGHGLRAAADGSEHAATCTATSSRSSAYGRRLDGSTSNSNSSSEALEELAARMDAAARAAARAAERAAVGSRERVRGSSRPDDFNSPTSVTSAGDYTGETTDGVIRRASDAGMKRLSWDFEDLQDMVPGAQARVIPYGGRFRVGRIARSDTVPVELGGTFHGSVTWVDSSYFLINLLGTHLWGFSQSIAFPLLAAAHANISQGLGLPPLDNLVLTGDANDQDRVQEAYRYGSPYVGKGARWSKGFLTAVTGFVRGAEPFVGSGAEWDGEQPMVGHLARAGAGAGAAKATTAAAGGADAEPLPYPPPAAGARNGGMRHAAYVTATVHRSVAHCAAPDIETVKGQFSIGSKTYSLTLGDGINRTVACLLQYLETGPRYPGPATRLPYRALLSDNNADQPGTRLLFSGNDLPHHAVHAALLHFVRRTHHLAPSPAEAEEDEVKGAQQALPPAAANGGYALLSAVLRNRPRRMCARRGVAVGAKDLMITGFSEANFVREMGRQMGMGNKAYVGGYVWPPQRVVLVDRDPSSPARSGHYGRWFENRAEMEEVLIKYEVPYEVVTDKQLYEMNFAQQAAKFGSAGLLIIAHGATESTAAFLPPRSAVIEISPYGMWCPLYTRMLTSAGHHVFPIASPLKASNLDYAYVNGRPKDEAKYLEQVQRLWKRCEAKGHVAQSLDGDCWHEYRWSAVQVPIHTFEDTLLQALEAIGMARQPKNASIARLHGLPDGVPAPPLVSAGWYKNHSYHLCSPQQQCVAIPP